MSRYQDKIDLSSLRAKIYSPRNSLPTYTSLSNPNKPKERLDFISTNIRPSPKVTPHPRPILFLFHRYTQPRSAAAGTRPKSKIQPLSPLKSSQHDETHQSAAKAYSEVATKFLGLCSGWPDRSFLAHIASHTLELLLWKLARCGADTCATFELTLCGCRWYRRRASLVRSSQRHKL